MTTLSPSPAVQAFRVPAPGRRPGRVRANFGSDLARRWAERQPTDIDRAAVLAGTQEVGVTGGVDAISMALYSAIRFILTDGAGATTTISSNCILGPIQILGFDASKGRGSIAPCPSCGQNTGRPTICRVH